MHMEFELVRKCSFIIHGTSGYGQFLKLAMNSGYSFSSRGNLPYYQYMSRPFIEIDQENYLTCELGNRLMCPKDNEGDNPINIGEYSKSNLKNLIQEVESLILYNGNEEILLNIKNENHNEIKQKVDTFVYSSIYNMCKKRIGDAPPIRGKYCTRLRSKLRKIKKRLSTSII